MNLTAASMIGAEVAKAIDNRMGGAAGMLKNTGASPDIYQQTAMASEMSQAQSAMKAIKKKGGIASSVDTDVAMAGISAAESQEAFKNKLKSMKAKGSSMEGMADSVEKEARRVAGASSRKQTQESMGAADGIEHEEKTHKKDKANPFRKVAQSSVESQTEGGLGSIRGAGGIHNLAWQSGVKAQSDSNSLRASISQAGGASSYIGLNEFGARKSITAMQSDRDAFNDTFGGSGYLGHKGFSAFRLAGAATGAKGYAEMKGTANAVGNVGLDVFEKNAQDMTSAGAKSTEGKVKGAGGSQKFVMASAISAQAQGAEMLNGILGAGGQSNFIQNAAYSSYAKAMQSTKEREQDLASKLAEVDSKTGLTKTSGLGETGMENEAVDKSVQKKKKATDRERQAEKLEKALRPKDIDRGASLAAIGINESALADGGKKMTAEQYRKIKLNSEKKIDKEEVNVIGTDGYIASTTVRSMATENADGSIKWNANLENQSSLQKKERGKKTELNPMNTLAAKGVDGAFGLFGEAAMYAAEGTAALFAAVGAADVYDRFVQRYSAAGAKATTNGGKTAIKGDDNHWYEVDENGQKTDKRVDNDLKSTSKKAWDGMKNGLRRMTAGQSVFNSEKDSMDRTTDGDNGKADGDVHNKSKHGNTPKSDIDNSTTKSTTAQRVDKLKNKIRSYWAEEAGDKMSAASERMSAAGKKMTDVYKHGHGGVGTKLTLAGFAGLGALFASNDAQAAEVPVKVTPKPVASGDKGMLDNISETLGLSALTAGVTSLATSFGNSGASKAISGVAGKAAAPVGAVAAMAEAAADANRRYQKGDYSGAALELVQGGLAAAGSVVGAAVGGTIGTGVAPGIGTAAGGIAGAVGGGIAGDSLGQRLLDSHDASMAAAQQQAHAQRQAYTQSVQNGGAYAQIQSAAANNPVSPAMIAGGSVSVSSLDMQAPHQIKQLAQNQADYTREISRSMDDMVSQLAALGGHFENLSEQKEGKVKSKA